MISILIVIWSLDLDIRSWRLYLLSALFTYFDPGPIITTLVIESPIIDLGFGSFVSLLYMPYISMYTIVPQGLI